MSATNEKAMLTVNIGNNDIIGKVDGLNLKENKISATDAIEAVKFDMEQNDQYQEITDNCSYTDESDTSDDDSEFSSLSGLSELSGQQWKPITKLSAWIQKQMNAGANPREILSKILGNGSVISQDLTDMALWRILASMLSEPPRRPKLRHINTIEDVNHLLRTCRNILVLTGAGVSVSCGIPDFRSSDGIYSRLANDFPGLPDPQAMFDIHYFSKDPRPFYKFAKEIYPGQFTPSTCHRFIKLLESKGILLRNYTQNIDTLERTVGVRNLIECHGSFATASCTKCKFKTNSDAIRDDILAQRIPMCPQCRAERLKLMNDNESRIENSGEIDFDETKIHYSELVDYGIMKPDIVFFGEGLPDTFHSTIAADKDKCDLLIVIGSSLKVHPVALIPRSITPDIPQILINRERLNQFEFDVELLGNSDRIISQICKSLGEDYSHLCGDNNEILVESKELHPRPPHQVVVEESSSHMAHIEDIDSQSSKSGPVMSTSSFGTFCDSGFESTSSSSNIGSVNGLENSTSNSITIHSNRRHSSNNHYHHRHHHHQHHYNHHHKNLKRRSTNGNISTENIKIMTESNDDPSTQRCHENSMENQKNIRRFPMDSTILQSSNDDSSLPSTLPVGSNNCDRLAVPASFPSPSTNINNKSATAVMHTLPSAKYTADWIPIKHSPTVSSISTRLLENTFYRHSKKGLYIFPGAQVYLNSDTESSSSDCETDNDEENDINDGDDNISSTDEFPVNKKIPEIPCFPRKNPSKNREGDDEDGSPPPSKKSCNL